MFDLPWGLKLHISMSFHAMILKRSIPVVVTLLLTAMPVAFGQLATSPIAFANLEAVTTTHVPAPSQGGTEGNPAGGDTNWFKVEWHYGATGNFKARYLDAVEFKVWVEGFDPDAKNAAGGLGASVAFTGDVNYVNVPNSKDLYGVVYLHPSTLARYSSPRGSEDYDRKFDVHVEAYVDGVLVDRIDKNKGEKDDWYKPFTVIPDLVFRQDQTPFVMADSDRYPAMKMSGSSGK
jgi:hypothetical protein